MALTALQYSTDNRGPWRLYVFGSDGYHGGGQWFARHVQYPGEEITVGAAKALAEAAIRDRMEVRICDAGDQLVFHSRYGAQLYPKPSVDFWAAIESVPS